MTDWCCDSVERCVAIWFGCCWCWMRRVRLTSCTPADAVKLHVCCSSRRYSKASFCCCLLISARSLGVCYFLSLTVSVCMSVSPTVCHKHWIFFFVCRWNRAIFGPSFLHVPLYKTLFFDFWFRPPNAQNSLPKICTKSPESRLVWQIDRRCLGLQGDFRGWPIQWNRAKCCGADPCPHVALSWQRNLG